MMSFAAAVPRRAVTAWHKLLAVLGGSAGGGAMLAFGSGALPSPWMVIALPVVLIGLAVLMLSPTLSFLLTAAIVPVERLGRLTADSSMVTISLMRIVGTITLASLLLTALVKRQKLYFGSAFWVYLLYFGIAITGVFHTTHTLGTVRHCGAILGNLLFLFIAVNLGRSHTLARNAVAVWLFATTAAGLYTIITWHFGAGVGEGSLGDTDSRFSTVLTDTSEWEQLDTVARATGPTSHSAVYGMNLITSLPLFLYFFKHTASRVWKWVILVAMAVTLYNVLLTNTRAVMLVAAFTIVLCGLRGMYRVTAGGVAVAVFAMLAVLPLVPSAIWTRVLDTSQYSQAKSATLRARFEYWEAGLEIVGENWLTGIGVGNQVEVPKRLSFVTAEETTVHNEFLFVAMEVGVFGWLVFFGFVTLMFVAARRAEKLAPHRLPPRELHADFFVAIQVSMIATLIFGLQVDVFHFPLKGWWLLAGLAFAQYRVMAESLPLTAQAHVHKHDQHALV